MSDQEGYDELLTDLKYLGDDDSVAEQQQKSIIEGQLVSSSEAAWDAMSPKLWCADDLMKLQLSGPEVAQIELCRDKGAPVSLAALPPHCGRTFPTYGGLVYATPYDGCGVMRQGGNYVVQVQWQGNSAVISCPVISTTTSETFLGPHPPAYLQILLPHSPPDTLSSAAATTPEQSTSETEQVKPTSQEVLQPQPHGYPQAFPQRFWPYYFPHYHYPGKVYPTAKPTESIAQAPTQKPQLPGYPQVFWPFYHNGKPKPPEKPVPTSIPTTSVAQPPTQKPQLPGYPQMFWPYYYPHYHHGKPKPPEKPAPVIPTTSQSSSLTTTQKQPPKYPGEIFPQYNYYPNYPLYLQEFYPQYPVQPLKTPTTPPITTTPQPCTTTAAAECKPSANQPPNEPPYVYIPPSSRLYAKDPFALQFVDFSKFADSFP